MHKRKFVYSGWEYALDAFQKLAIKKKYSIRFRLEFFHLLSEKTSIKQLLLIFFQNLGANFKCLFILAKYQLIGRFQTSNPDTIVIMVAKNNVYLQTLKPVIQNFANKKADILVLCPDKHFHFIKEYLGKEVDPYLYKIESIIYEPRVLVRFLRLLGAFLVSASDTIWFMVQPVKKSLWFATTFGRYGLTQYYFSKSLEKYFSSGAKLISANDHWMWESLYFTSARKSNAPCYVFQHGVIGDITYPIFANQFLTWGKFDFEKMQSEFGAKPDEVRILGSPHFDAVYQKINAVKTSDSQFSKPYITFLSQPFFNSNFLEPGYYQKILDRFCLLAPIAKKFGKKLVIKLHPADKNEYYSQFQSDAIITRDGLLEVLDDTCLAFTIDSTAIFEAVMYAIPVTQCWIKDMSRQIDFSSSGLCVSDTSDDGILLMTNELLGSASLYYTRVNKGNSALDNYFFKIGGTLSRIEKLLGIGL